MTYGTRVYVAGPMSKGDAMQNVRGGIDTAQILMDLGFLPFVPHLSVLHHLVWARPYEDWLQQDFGWIRACHALLRLPGESAGADREVAFAESIGLPVFHSTDTLREYFAERQSLQEG